jgi:O-antigen ligase
MDAPRGTDPFLGRGMALLAFALPLVLLPPSSDFYTVPKTFLLYVAILLGLLRVAGRASENRASIPLTPLSLPLLILLGVCLLSLLGAAFPWAGIEAAWRLWNGILLYHLAVAALTPAPVRRWFLGAVALSILPVAVYGILQVMGFDFLRLAMRQVPVSSLGNTGFVAEYLVAALPIAFTLATKGDTRWWWLFSCIVLLGSLHLLLTQSRAGWLGAALGGGILLLASSSHLRRGVARARLGRLALSGLLLAVGIGLLMPDLGPASVARLRSILDPDQATARVRLLIWRGALDLATHHPILGVGLGNFEFAYPEVRSVEEWRLSRRDVVDDAHNEYLHTLVETGLLGLAAFLWFLFHAARSARDLLRSPEARNEALPLVAALAGLLLYAGFGFPFKDPTSGAYWWMFLGYLSAMGCKKDGPAVPLALTRSAAITHSALAVLLVFGAFLADLHIRRMQVLSRQGRDREAAAEYRAALRLYVPLAWTHRLRSLVHDDRRMIPLLVADHERRLRIGPNDAWLLAELGGLYGMLGRLEEAKATLRRAIALRSDLSFAHENLGTALLLSGDTQGALSELEMATRLDPSNARPRYKLAVALYRASRKDDAEEQFRRAKSLDPALPEFLRPAGGEKSLLNP